MEKTLCESAIGRMLGAVQFDVPPFDVIQHDEDATRDDLVRVLGFAQTPNLLAIFFIPTLGTLISFFARIWTCMAMIVALRQSLTILGRWT